MASGLSLSRPVASLFWISFSNETILKLGTVEATSTAVAKASLNERPSILVKISIREGGFPTRTK